jgi:hypothetical protein
MNSNGYFWRLTSLNNFSIDCMAFLKKQQSIPIAAVNEAIMECTEQKGKTFCPPGAG